MTRAFPSKGNTRLGLRANIAASSVKQDNCQGAVMLSLANHHASLPMARRLYLPKEWADDEALCRKVGVPDDVDFNTNPEITLEQMRRSSTSTPPS